MLATKLLFFNYSFSSNKGSKMFMELNALLASDKLKTPLL